mgnify:CR=1 FL=1
MKLIYRGLSYDRLPAADKTPGTTAATPHTLLYRGIEYQTNPGQANSAASVALHTPVELVYRGVHYTIGTTQSAPSVAAAAATDPVAFQPESITELARELLITLRQKTDRREQSVLTRFKADIGVTDRPWTVYRHQDAAMS